MDKFQNKYRIPSARLQTWDYRWNSAYFITICTNNREHYFGHVHAEKMVLSPIGVIADIMWHEIKNHTHDIDLGEFVVMPNHVHGILVLNGHGNDRRNVACNVSTRANQNAPTQPNFYSMISPKSNSVSTIVRSYKSAVSKHAHRLGFTFEWQPRFHDHIIRYGDEQKRIANYIINNPKLWGKDKFNA